MIPQDWIDAGYKRWETNKTEINKLADFGLQKRIDDETGKKYFITVYVYDWRPYKERGHIGPEFGFMPDVQFGEFGESEDTNVSPIIDVTYHVRETDTVEKIEKFYEDMWEHLKRPYYERWNVE